MRRSLAIAAVVTLASSHAQADDLAIGASVGAGGQGDAGYGALELRLDAEWRGIRLGLGGRAVWEGGALRTREWSRPLDAIALLRHLEAHLGPAALAAGALAPSTLGHVADGYRAALDDRPRTGARLAIATRGLPARDRDRHSDSNSDRDGRDGRDDRDDRDDRDVDIGIDIEALVEIDDVLDPALVGGALAWHVTPAWGLRTATAVDPATSRVAIEAGAARRWERDDSRLELGASLVTERWLSTGATPASKLGGGAVGFASAAFDRAHARWTVDADLRVGTGTNGAAFGPLYRAERAPSVNDANSAMSTPAILDDVHAGVGGGLRASVTSDRGWLSLGGRWRPGLGALGTLTAGAPMGRYLQAAGWIAATPRATAGAAELRAVWATHYSSSLQLARMYTGDAMTSALAPAWSATVWFGVSTR